MSSLLPALIGLRHGVPGGGGGGGFPWRIVIVLAVVLLGAAWAWWRARRS